MEQSYHVLNGSYMAGGADWKSYLQTELPEAFQNGGEVRLQFENAAEYEACRKELNKVYQDTLYSSGYSGTVDCVIWYIHEFRVIYIGVTKK